MIFTYRKWEEFCKKLSQKGIYSIPARMVCEKSKQYLVLKHDVETNVSKAYDLAKIEHKYNHKGTYYVQAYLLSNPKNIEILKSMEKMGHEVSYHHDVMDACKGNLHNAIKEFEGYLEEFKRNGFSVETVCQHGNPIIEREGYNSNRDFFRSKIVQEKYPEISDIMVNYQEVRKTEYRYFSDAGREFKMIYDPLYNDIVDSEDKNVKYKDLDGILNVIDSNGRYMLSIHPHRWTKSRIVYLIKTATFKCIKTLAKILMKNAFMKKMMSKYYYIAKKI